MFGNRERCFCESETVEEENRLEIRQGKDEGRERSCFLASGVWERAEVEPGDMKTIVVSQFAFNARPG